MVTLDEAKAYLRVDSSFEDELIASLLMTAQALCTDVARLSASEWEALSAYGEDSKPEEDGEPDSTGDTDIPSVEERPLVIRKEEKSQEEILQMRSLLRVGILYAVGYLYEHREEADHHGLVLTLRNILFSIREGVV